MGRNNYFQFKQFKITQEKSAMKVGTDGVLLGAWANVEGANKILDIGTGTGMIAIMLAQRTTAEVIGVEIEKEAASEANMNVEHSPWHKRIQINNISFQDFGNSTKERFDVIVSNPPFFENSSKNANNNVAVARHNDSLSFQDLIKGVDKLLRKKGIFSVILPVVPANQLIELASQESLYLIRLTKIKPDVLKNANRYLMEFSKEPEILVENSLIIYNKNHSDYTSEYKFLTKDFYLLF